MIAEYVLACTHGKLTYHRCTACGHAQLPARRLCAACRCEELDLLDSAGQGALYSFTVVHRAPDAYYRQAAPYVLGLVDLDEGFRALMLVDGDPAVPPALGARLTTVMRPTGPDQVMLPHAVPVPR